MPRLRRIYLEDTLYYVTCRGDYDHQIFTDKKDFSIFFELLKKYKDQYGFRLYAYVCLPNHFHLLLEFPRRNQEDYKGGISEIMHDLNSSYTKYFNGRYQRKGHLFRERFKATLVDKKPYLLKLTAYMHRNPQTLELVSDAKEYPYSSYIFYLGKEAVPQELIGEEKDEALSLLIDESYEHFVESIMKELTDLHKPLKKGVLGGEDFKNKVRQALDSNQKEEIKEDNREDNKEEIVVKRKTRFIEKAGIVILIIILLSFGLFNVFRLTSKTKVSDNASDPLSLKYQTPEQIQELLKDLENTEWRIRLVSVSGGPVQTDVIRFYEGKFTSDNLAFKSFLSSEYNLVIEDDNRIVWETTMQRGDEGRASWRGEIVKSRMSGTLTIRQKGLENRDFSFVSVGYKIIEQKI